MTDSCEAQLARVADLFVQRTEEVVELQVRLAGAFGSYRVVPPAEFQRSARRNVLRVVAALRGQADLPLDVDEDEWAAGRRRALQGVPSVDVLAAYRVGVAGMRDEFLAVAKAQGLSVDAMLLGTQRIWELGDRYSGVLLAAQREVELDLARGAEQHRMALLSRLLSGAMDVEQMSAEGAGVGLVPDRRYWVVRARAHGVDPAMLTRMLEAEVGSQQTLLAGALDGDVAAVLSRPIAGPTDSAVTVALAGPVTLSELPAGYAESTRLLDTATRFGTHGVVDRHRMALRLAVVAQPELGGVLHARYIEPVEKGSGIAELLLNSVETYLRQRRSVASAALALSVHVNTLRYRLERFSLLTGSDLQDTETLFEVWWALQRRRVCAARPTVSDPCSAPRPVQDRAERDGRSPPHSAC